MGAKKYLAKHKMNVYKSFIIPKPTIIKGMILDIKYQKKSKGILDNYMILVLDEHQDKIHALSLDHISPAILNDLVRKIGLVSAVGSKVSKKLKMNISSERLYNTMLKEQMNNTYNKSYRVFNLSEIKTVKVVDYEFEPDILKAFAEKYKEE